MKHIFRKWILFVALITSAAGNVWAITQDDIVIADDIEHGSVSFKSIADDGKTVTISVTPGEGYYIKKKDIVVQKLAAPNLAPARALRRISVPIAEVLEVTGVDEAFTEADYVFVIPEGYAGALVTVTFTEKPHAEAIVKGNNLTYNQAAQELVTAESVKGGTLVYSLSENGTYSETIPTKTAVGDYTVYWKVNPFLAYSAINGSVKVSIGKARLTSVTLDKTAKKHTGSAITFSASEVKAGTLTVPTDGYTITGNVQTDEGSYTATVTGTVNYTGTVTARYHIVGTSVVLIDENTAPSAVTALDGKYILTSNVNASVFANLQSGTFTGTLDGDFYQINCNGYGKALFDKIAGGTVKNVILTNVGVSAGDTNGDAGAIANSAIGASRIYNCGILPTTVVRDADGYLTGFTGSSVSGTRHVGGLVGLLGGEARVINCYSYANITGGTNKGGIVGYNNVASTQSSLTTMVMNCLFYGDIADGNTIAPIYGGTEINNVAGGLNNYNYYRYRSRYSKEKKITTYNRALAMEEKFITRFERYRLLLNSNKKLAAKYASTNAMTVIPDEMAKWVLETADRSISGRDPYPYPILKAQGYYPSIINYDAENAPDSTSVGRLKGGKLGSKMLAVTILKKSQRTTGGQDWPTAAASDVQTTSLKLIRTDKDTVRFNYNYDKVQLPYYNDIGTGNYTENRVVTGWKITSITGGTEGTYTESDSWGGYNFADRHCTKKDKYETSKRVFSQGAYWDVPEGVTAITIEPYWAIANYVSDGTYDVVYNKDYAKQNFTPFGTQYTNNTNIDIHGDGNNQKVYTSIDKAIAGFDNSSKTVYDQAVVLVGNLHQYANPTADDKPYTVMSIDMNYDNEPDYSFIFSHDNRKPISPIRFDFLNIMGIAEAQLPKLTLDTDLFRNVSIFNLKGWFEITNTCVVNFSQFEYDNSNGAQNAVTKSAAPLILLGGTYEQIVSTQKATLSTNPPKTKYIHVGSNAWFAKFGTGTHSDGSKFTPHVPISVTGGDYDEFYLSGTYQPNITNMQSDNAECYVSGGRFGDMAGASLEAIWGDVRWDIDYADITNFYGGGVNANNPITGNIRVDMVRSHVEQYCGGPKFGDMSTDKNVITNATDCTFGTFFGAGYGGNSYNRVKYWDVKDKKPSDYQSYYTNDRGKYYDGVTTNANKDHTDYGQKGKGVATDFDSEFFIWSSGVTGARFYVQFVSFSLARTNNVTSNLTGCTINKNFYGGGSLGKVNGTASSTLDGCTVKGNVFGGGYSATLPKIGVRNTPAFVAGKEPGKNINIGMFEEGEIAETVNYEWQHVESMPDNSDPGMESTSAGNFVYTNEDLTTLGQVGTVNLTITNNTTVGESVYGGGEESGVGGDTHVTVNSGSIGVENDGKFGYRWGNVYGGGKGKIEIKSDGSSELALKTKDDLNAGLVKGNTNIEINGGTILHNVYGGGAVGSVGTFDRDANGMPTACTSGGLATVTINGGKIGHDHQDTGMVNGSSRGWEGNPNGTGALAFLNQLAWVNNANVTIGSSTSTEEDKGPTVFGSVYGGGENGHNLENAVVTINKGKVGYDKGTWDCGNIYGAGCGTDTYTIGENPTERHNPMAGIVQGTTSITINGGNVLRNVYGGGSMGSVGTYTYDGNGLPTTCEDETGNTTININGGVIGTDNSNEDYGHVFGGPKGNLKETAYSASVRETSVNINTGADVKGSVFGGGEAGIVKESVVVNMNGGTVGHDFYGGGALANTNTANWDATKNSDAGGWADGKYNAGTTAYNTQVMLKGGTINGNVYGGGLGRLAKAAVAAVGTEGQPGYKPAESAVNSVEAKVYGDVLVKLNGTPTVKTIENEQVTEYNDDCVVKGSIFGCNNLNGSPQSSVTVHVYKTVGWAGHAGTASGKLDSDNKADHNYHLKAVYGGGNLAKYEPGLKATADTAQTYVIIDGCDMTSIETVYGGGNAASTPATNVTINGTYEIEELFGGGNGADDYVLDGKTYENPGANVGYRSYAYHVLGDDGKYKAVEYTTTDGNDKDASTKEKRQENWSYGSGKASVNIYGGLIHRVFGGSNTKGNVRQTAVTLLDENSGCDFCVDEAYGGGKSAEMDAEAQLLMACIPGLQAVYGGAEAADVHGNVTLNITNGTFDRVFGGNNLSGTIGGSITVNVEEIGCKPVMIGELYGGGNQAGYSIYGYDGVDADGRAILKESGDNPWNNPVVNVKSFTSIGNIYGGGYGRYATMVGNPTVNVNEIYGKYYNNDASVVDENAKTPNNYPIPSHAKGKMGAINNVFGGGNAAKVIGNTTVHIGTLPEVYVVKQVTVGDDVSGYYTRNNDGTYTEITTGTAVNGTTYYEKKDVLGADIRGNVYGGGNNAEVTGNTNVVIGKKETSE